MVINSVPCSLLGLINRSIPDREGETIVQGERCDYRVIDVVILE